MVGLGVLDVGVGGELDPVAPGVEEIGKAGVEQFDAHLLQPLDGERLVVHGDAEMPALVRPLAAAGHEVDELVAKIDEGRLLVLERDVQIEEAAVEVQRFLDVADLERDMVDADGLRPGSCGVCHAVLRVSQRRPPDAGRVWPGDGGCRPRDKGRRGRAGGVCRQGGR